MGRTWVAALAAALLVTATGCTVERSGDDEAGTPLQGRAVAASTGKGVKRVTVRKREVVHHRTVTRRTTALDKGVTRVVRRGRDGVRIRVYRVTSEQGVRTSRMLLRTRVVRRAVPRVVLRGTRVQAAGGGYCDLNYAHGCVPVAVDVDCGGGSGDGPSYVYGRVRVVGVDIYDLDGDGDGWGCD